MNEKIKNNNENDYEVRTVSAQKKWWARLDAAHQKSGIASRSNFIRLAVDKYIEENSNGS